MPGAEHTCLGWSSSNGQWQQPVTATLRDAPGRVVRTQQLPAGVATHARSLTNVAPGVYSLRLATGQDTISKKLAVD